MAFFSTNTRRIVKTGFFNFWRNGFVSLSSIVVMIVTLSVIGGLVFLSAILNSTLTEIKNKVDINVYFVTSAGEDQILSLKKTIEGLPEVAEVTYTSREEALVEFRQTHANDEVTLQALDELGDNPLGATLNIRAKDPSQYEGIAKFLTNRTSLSAGSSSVIDKINYFQNKTAIDRLSRIIDSANRLGLVVILVLAIISVIITFNTIRLAIFISRDEISVMRLVGAEQSYIRGPFVVAGLMYGAVAAIITLILFFPATYWLGGATQNFFIGLNVFSYYLKNFGQFFLILVGSGALIGAVSSIFAARKYLKV
ncbi:MAG TPA: permease-like cell division protein FtsX, partial [Candidatus Paceibacterota bacterium]